MSNITEINGLNITAATASFVLASAVSGIVASASYAFTSSIANSSSFSSTSSYLNNLSQNLILSGNLSISGNLNVFGTASYTYITASQLDVGTNTISVNVAEPAERFGGLLVYDSGSLSHQATASMLWDSLNNHWVYQNASGSTYSGGMLMSGPRNTGSLGDEPSLTRWFIARSDGGDHLNNTQIYSSASIHIVTGSLTVTEYITGSFTGSLQGTASYANSASQAISSSYALTASYAMNGGGGGSITEIQAGDSSITVTNGTGPVVTLTANNSGGGTDLGLTYVVSIGYIMP